MVYWKSLNLIGSPVVFYSLVEHNSTHVALGRGIFLNFDIKIHKFVGGLLLSLVLYEQLGCTSLAT